MSIQKNHMTTRTKTLGLTLAWAFLIGMPAAAIGLFGLDGQPQAFAQTGTTAPVVTSMTITSSPNDDAVTVMDGERTKIGDWSVYGIDDSIEVTVAFSVNVTVTGSPRLELEVGGSARAAEYESTDGSNVKFSYTVAESDEDTDGVSIGANKLTLNGGTIRGDADQDADLSHDTLSAQKKHKVDGIRPSFKSIRFSASNTYNLNGYYEEGEEVFIKVQFSEGSIYVSGTPQLTIDVGGKERNAAFERTSFGDLFVYTVQEGDLDLDGPSFSANSVNMNGGYIRDGAGNDIKLNHGGASAGLDSRIDAVVPTVSAVAITSDPGADDTYAAGDMVQVSVTFSEEVWVPDTSRSDLPGTRHPELDLRIGNDTRSAKSGLQELGRVVTFTYTIQSGDTDTDGISINANGLRLNGGVIFDAAGNNPISARIHNLFDIPLNAVVPHHGLADDPGHKVATGAPSITGTAQVGETLTVNTTGIADADGLDNAAFTYQWLADDADISGATGSSYTLAAADEGKTIKVKVSFTDDQNNNEELTSAATAAVTAAPPPNNEATGQPAISGTAQVGETLTAETSAIVDADGLDNAAFTYQWIASDGTSDSDIEGATEATYTLTDSDVGKTIKVRVSFSDDLGNEETLTSEATAAVEPAPNSPATGLPTISGAAQVGETLTADVSSIADADGLDNATFSYQWLADDADISGATGSTYTLTYSEQGQTVKVRVNFTDDAGNPESLTSAATAVVAASTQPDSSEEKPSLQSYITVVVTDDESDPDNVGTSFTITWNDADACSENYNAYVSNGMDVARGGDKTLLGPAPSDGAEITASLHNLRGEGLRFYLELYCGTEDSGQRVSGVDIPHDEEDPSTSADTKRRLVPGIYSSEPPLTALSVSPGTLTSAFHSHTFEYAVPDVGNADGRITVTATGKAGYTVAFIRGDDSLFIRACDPWRSTPCSWDYQDETDADADTPGFQLDLDEGENNIAVYVYNYYDSGRSYRLTVTRAANTPATGLPTIAGAVQVGETLTAETSAIVDADGLDNAAFTYQWIASDGTSDSDIEGATEATYTLTDSDVGKTIKVRVSFTDDRGNPETLDSEATATVGDAVVWESELTAGQTTDILPVASGYSIFGNLGGTLSPEGWEMDGTSYRVLVLVRSSEGLWLGVDGELPVDFTLRVGESTYVGSESMAPPVTNVTALYWWPSAPSDWFAGDTIQVSLTFHPGVPLGDRQKAPVTGYFRNFPSEHDGNEDVSFRIYFSEGVATTADALRDHVLAVSGGAVSGVKAVGDEGRIWAVSVKPDSTDTVTVEIKADLDCEVAGAVCAADGRRLFNYMKLIVAGVDEPMPEPENSPATGAPTITGTARVGETLTADTSGIADADGLTNVTYGYQWIRNDGSSDTDIAGAADSTYTLEAADAGGTVKVRVSFTDDADNEESLTSAATATVDAAPNSPATGAPAISGNAQVGETLTADTSGIADEDGLSNASFSYQWVANDGTSDTDITDATDYTYTLAADDEGKTVKVRVSFTDDANNEESLTSAATATVDAAPNSPATGTPAISGTAQVGETLTADTSGIADADGLSNASFSYQWQADGADISDATSDAYTPADADEGKVISVTVSFTDDAGNDETLTSAATGAVEGAPTTPLTASLENVATSHDGETAFTFELRFSEELSLSYKTLRNHAFTVTGGTVKKAQRLDKPSNILWRITVRADGDGNVTIILPVTEDCDAQGAICTEDGRKLSNELVLTVSGP